MTDTRFLRWFAGSVLVVMLACCAFNYLVDPYLIFGRARTPGFNAIKAAAGSNEPMLKAYQATRADFKAVVLGSSRAAIGIDPAAKAWPSSAQPVYNLGVAGADLGECIAYLQVLTTRAGGTQPPVLVVAGLDFESFLRAGQRPGPAPAPDDRQLRLQRLAQAGGQAPQAWMGRWQEAGAGTLTLTALLDSAATVAASMRGSGPDVRADGTTSDWQLRQWTAADGPKRLFEQKLAQTAKQMQRGSRQLRPAPGAPMHGMDEVDRLIAMAQQGRTRLILAVQPSHVAHFELLDALGLWNDLEQWKQALTTRVAEARARGLDVTLWDFAGYEQPFQEPLPQPVTGAKAAPLQWFWDPVHYNRALGDRLLAAMLGTEKDANGLGQRLEPATITARLDAVRAARDDYRRRHPDAVAAARGIVGTEAPRP